MHAEALSTLLLGAIEAERHRRESSGKWIVRADEGTTPAMIADEPHSAMPKARAIDIDSLPTSARRGDNKSMRLRQTRWNGAALSSEGSPPPIRGSILILILIRTRPLAVAVIIAAIVVVAVVIGRPGGGRADCCGAVGCGTSRVIPSGITGDRTTRAAGYGITGPARATGNRVAWMRSPGIPVSASAVDTSGTAAKVGGPRTAAVKTAAATKAAASAASACRGIIWNQTGDHQNGRCEPDQTVPNHGILPTLEFRVPPMAFSSDAAPIATSTRCENA